MSFWFNDGWMKTSPLGRALMNLMGYQCAAWRDSRFFPGIAHELPQGNWGGGELELQNYCLLAADKIWAKSKEIGMLWSGGSDSTLALSSLLFTRPSNCTLYVINDQSTRDAAGEENIKFLINNDIRIIGISIENVTSFIRRGGVLVSGRYADSSLGGEVIRHCNLYETVWDMSEKDVLYHVGRKRELPDVVINQYIEDLEPVLATLPFERNGANSSWWLDYMANYNEDVLAGLFCFGVGKYGTEYVNFFMDRDIQRWHLQPVTDKVGRTEKTFKQVYRHIIGDLLGFNPKLTMGDTPNDSIGEPINANSLLLVKEDFTILTT